MNAYRCLFNTDTGVVVGGCPNPPAVSPGAAPDSPTTDDIAARDRLIQQQESLLNAYRCRFDVDTQLVPGGCGDGEPASPPPTDGQEQTGDEPYGTNPNPEPEQPAALLIEVPDEAPSGRCANHIPRWGRDGWQEGDDWREVYNWETLCALRSGYDPSRNRTVSDDEADDLAQRIWREIDVEGKPQRSPAITTCEGEWCTSYTPEQYGIDRHYIQREKGNASVMSLVTLLHELAHALTVGHPTVAVCWITEGDPDYLHDLWQACGHNDIFRCVVNHLYMEYVGIKDAGVCGNAAKLSPVQEG